MTADGGVLVGYSVGVGKLKPGPGACAVINASAWASQMLPTTAARTRQPTRTTTSNRTLLLT